tara:strand:- start:2733 stop:3578 length:846 start_codon:yes stop_codon:yes gene_type:complete
VKIGILGQGYVGKAVKTVFAEHFEDVVAYDKYIEDLSDVLSLEDLVLHSKIIFICLPTEMKENGECDVSIVEEEIKKVNFLSKPEDNRVVVIKSTVIPGTTQRIANDNKNINIIFNPEFLTELNFLDDFRNQTRVILGGEKGQSFGAITDMYKLVFPNIPIIVTSSKIAEMVKYLTNTFLANKVSFANQMKDICDSAEIDFDEVVQYATYDERLGKSHWAVPGTDGKPGFGGSCFPKDLNALIYFAKSKGVDPYLLDAMWSFNLNIRLDRNWEKKKDWEKR